MPFHFCIDELLMLMSVTPFLGVWARRVHDWYHTRVNHKPHANPGFSPVRVNMNDHPTMDREEFMSFHDDIRSNLGRLVAFRNDDMVVYNLCQTGSLSEDILCKEGGTVVWLGDRDCLDIHDDGGTDEGQVR